MSEAAESTLRRTPLFQAHVALGAEFGNVFGWEMVRSYGDTLAEYRAVRTAAGVSDLSYYGAIRVGGKEGAQFLNGLVTNDVKSLAKGKGLRAAFLTGHGKVRALCRVFGLGDEYLVLNDPQTHQQIFGYISPFTFAGDFKVEDVTDEYRVISVQGPHAPLIVKEVCFEPVPQLEEHAWMETIIGGHHVKVARASHTGETGYDIFVGTAGLNDVWDFLLLKGAFHSLRPVGLEALDWLRIEAGNPVYGIDVDESNMMLETGLSDAVSLTKGCYTGQEAVAMATYRGHVAKRLSGLVAEGDAVPARGDQVLSNGKQIGQVTSGLRSPTLGAGIALAYLKYGHFDPGNTVEIATAGATVQATVVELPFVKTGHAKS